MDFEFRPRVGVTIVAVLIAFVVAALAVWQMSRFFEKSALEEKWGERQTAPPSELTDLEDFNGNDLDYRRVEAIGTLDTTRRAIYDFHRFRGEPGCLIANPLQLRDGGTIIVVRGFVPHTQQTRCDDATVSPPGAGPYLSLVHTPSPNLADVANREQPGPNLRWDTFDIEGTYAAWKVTNGPATPTVLVLDQQHVGDPFPLATFDHVSDPYLTSMRHLNYAGTWMVLLLCVFGVWGGASIRRVRPA